MSAIRAALGVIGAVCNHVASTPPNIATPNERYDTKQPRILRAAPFIFRLQVIFLWACTVAEIFCYLRPPVYIPPLFSLRLAQSSCPGAIINPTISFIVGSFLVFTGALIRLHCYKTLGDLFTFDLTVRPNHRLVVSGLYGYVRHPAYTGSLCLIFGMSFSHLSRGSWLVECGPLSVWDVQWTRWALGAIWWLWAGSVCWSRAVAEDEQMRALFGKEWEQYASRVKWWFFPGLA